MSKILLLDTARKELADVYPKKIHNRKGEPHIIATIDWLIQNSAKLNGINYTDNLGNTILHLLMKDLPFLLEDNRVELLFTIDNLSKLFIRSLNRKNNAGEIPLDIILNNLFCKKQSNKSSIKDATSLWQTQINISLRYIEYFIMHKSNTKKLQDNDNLLNLVLMCKTNDDLKILMNILNNLDDEFKKTFISQKNKLDNTLNKFNSVGENIALIKFTEWLIGCYLDFKPNKTFNAKLFSTVQKLNISDDSKDYLLDKFICLSNNKLQHKKSKTKINNQSIPKAFGVTINNITEGMNCR